MSSISTIHLSAFGQEQAFSKKNDLVKSLRSIYFFTRALGLLPFSIVTDSNGKVKKARLSTLDLLLFVVAMFIHVSMAVGFLQIPRIGPTDYNHMSYALVLGDSILILLGLIFGIMVRIMDMCNRFKLVDIVKKLAAFDKEVSIFLMFSIRKFN